MIPHDVITSTANPRLREAARLREAQARRDSGLTLVDGGREVRRALAAGVALVELFVDEATLARADAGSHDPDATGLPSGPDLDRWLGELVAGARADRVGVVGGGADGGLGYMGGGVGGGSGHVAPRAGGWRVATVCPCGSAGQGCRHRSCRDAQSRSVFPLQSRGVGDSRLKR